MVSAVSDLNLEETPENYAQFLNSTSQKILCDRHFGTAKVALKKADNIETFGEVLNVIKG